jgi:hypothetical protein
MQVAQRYGRAGIWAAWLTLMLIRQSSAASVQPETLTAWNKDVQSAKEELTRKYHNLHPATHSGKQERAVESSQREESGVIPQVSGEMFPVPSGLIHHWTGNAFIPNVQAVDVLAVLQDYDSYADVYKPAVIESRLLSHTGNVFTYRMKFIQKGFGIKAGLLGEFRTTYSPLTPESGYSITEATQVLELQNPGTLEEKVVPPSESHGYVQKVLTIVRYQQSDGGVSVEVETLTLSRGVPTSVRWLIAPLVQRFSRQAMTATMERLRDRMRETQSFASAAAR